MGVKRKTENYKPQTTNYKLTMEVHHHTHAPKRWNQYIWEFLMLFLAVFAGFMAENWREHVVERHREKQFMISMASDLKKDIQEFDSLLKKRNIREIQIDSLNFILRSPDPDQFGRELYFYSRYLPRPFVFYPNDATIQQLKNSGNLRLIHKQTITDTILAYDRQFHFIDNIRVREEQLIQRIFFFLDELFDPTVFDEMNIYDIEFTWPRGNPKLLTKDKKTLQHFLSEIHYLKTLNIGQIGWFQKQRQRAASTLAFIQKEYRIESQE
jgi:hypothetical protein